MPLSIDVVLVVYNHYELTESCLRHLAAQTREHRVIVVDNGSTDDTRARLRAEWPQHELVAVERNQALSRSTNLGAARGSGDVILWINNDVDCRPDFLERLVAPMDADPQLGSACGLMLAPGEELIDSFGLTADRTLAGFPRLQRQPAGRAHEQDPAPIGPAGTAAAYRRSAWEAVGGLDERIFAYSEDLDLALRFGAAGWRTVLVPEAVGVHLGSATNVHRSQRQRRNGGFARGYLLRRYGVLRSRAALRALVTETIVCAGDLVISRDLAATRGRVEGWRAARGLARHDRPDSDAIDATIGFRESLDLRRGIYAQRAA